MKKQSVTNAFTLLELAIVILIIAVVTGMGIISTENVLRAAHRTQTDNKLDAIEKALMDFRMRYNRLPCPADITVANGTTVTDYNGSVGYNYVYGTEVVIPSSGICFITGNGAVPIKTLNLPDEYMVDGWGNRFTYNVDTLATESLQDTQLDRPGAEAITVLDATGALRTGGALYVLISHGPNGYGAYLPDGTQNDPAPAAADLAETNNIVGGTVTQKEEQGVAGTFDDIVRFKVRWQLQSRDDEYSYDYTGAQLIVGGTNGTNLWLGGLKFSASGWVPSKNIWGSEFGAFTAGSVVADANIKAILFTPNNSHLFVYAGTNGGAGRCALFKITGDEFALLPGTSVPSCPLYLNNSAVAMSDNGYLAIFRAGQLHLWKQAGDQFIYLGYKTPAGSPASYISFSHNAELLTLNSASDMKLYRRSDNDFVPISSPVGGPAFWGSVVVSPNGRYIAALSLIAPFTLYWWRVNPDYTFTALGPSVVAAGGAGVPINFSRDGRYIMLGIDGSNQTIMQKIDADAFNPITGPVVTLPLFLIPDNTGMNIVSGSGTTIQIQRQTALQNYVINQTFGISSSVEAAAFSY